MEGPTEGTPYASASPGIAAKEAGLGFTASVPVDLRKILCFGLPVHAAPLAAFPSWLCGKQDESVHTLSVGGVSHHETKCILIPRAK